MIGFSFLPACEIFTPTHSLSAHHPFIHQPACASNFISGFYSQEIILRNSPGFCCIPTSKPVVHISHVKYPILSSTHCHIHNRGKSCSTLELHQGLSSGVPLGNTARITSRFPCFVTATLSSVQAAHEIVLTSSKLKESIITVHQLGTSMITQYEEPPPSVSDYPTRPRKPASLGVVRLGGFSRFFLSPSKLWIFRSSRLILCVLRYLLGFFYGCEGFMTGWAFFAYFLVSVSLSDHPQDDDGR